MTTSDSLKTLLRNPAVSLFRYGSMTQPCLPVALILDIDGRVLFPLDNGEEVLFRCVEDFDVFEKTAFRASSPPQSLAGPGQLNFFELAWVRDP
jgi:hypothetical protein